MQIFIVIDWWQYSHNGWMSCDHHLSDILVSVIYRSIARMQVWQIDSLRSSFYYSCVLLTACLTALLHSTVDCWSCISVQLQRAKLNKTHHHGWTAQLFLSVFQCRVSAPSEQYLIIIHITSFCGVDNLLQLPLIEPFCSCQQLPLLTKGD